MTQTDPVVKVIEVEEYIENGVIVSRAAFDVNGHDVQIVSYNHSENVGVKVDSTIIEMHIDHVDQFIKDRT
jgi:hypothetical protein